MLQQTRKVGHWQVGMLQFLRGEQGRLRLPHVAVDSQPWGLSMAIFSYLLQHKFAQIFQIKQPLFWKKIQICPSLRIRDWRKYSADWFRSDDTSRQKRCFSCRAHVRPGDGHLVRLAKKVVFRFVKIWWVCLAEVSKRWPLGGPKAANLLPLRTDNHGVILYGTIAALPLANGHLF